MNSISKSKHPPDKSDLVPPDGGWGWVVIVGCFFNYFFLGSMAVTYSVILNDVMIAMDVTTSSASWVSSIRIFIGMVLGPLVASFSLKYSFRRAILIGGIFCFAGSFFTFFARRIEIFYVTYGLIGGIGFAFVHGPTLYGSTSYFSAHRGRATGVLVGGMPCGRMAMTPVIQLLLFHYGFRGVLLINSALVLNILVGGSLVQPVKWHLKKPPNKDPVSQPLMTSSETCPDATDKQKDANHETDENTNIVCLNGNGASKQCAEVKKQEEEVKEETKEKKVFHLDVTFFKNPKFYVVCASSTAIVCVNPYVGLFLPALGLSKGFTPMEAASLLSIIAGAELIGRVFTPWAVDYKLFTPKTLLIICTFCYAQCLWGFAIAPSYIAMAFICTIGGFFAGGLMPSNILTVTKLLGPEKMPAALSLIHFVQSFFTLFMGPLLGFARDYSGNYTMTFGILSSLQFLAFSAWIGETLVTKCKASKEHTSLEITPGAMEENNECHPV